MIRILKAYGKCVLCAFTMGCLNVFITDDYETNGKTSIYSKINKIGKTYEIENNGKVSKASIDDKINTIEKKYKIENKYANKCILALINGASYAIIVGMFPVTLYYTKYNREIGGVEFNYQSGNWKLQYNMTPKYSNSSSNSSSNSDSNSDSNSESN